MNTGDQSADALVVVVGIDFSPVSSGLLSTAAEIAGAGKEGGELHVLHVVAHGESVESTLPLVEHEIAHPSGVDPVHARLERMVKGIETSVQRAALHVRTGRADVEIVQLAHDVDANVIVVGTHGRTGLKRLLLGSVAESVVRHAPCPVMAYRHKSTPVWEQIAPPCSNCIAVQRATKRAQIWCERHSEHHARAHTYSGLRWSYGMGSMTFR